MNKKSILGILAIALGYGISYADITITVPANCDQSSVAYYCAPIKQYAGAKSRAERGIVADSVKLVDSKAVIAIPTEADSYLFGLNIENNNVPVYAVPGEKINIDVTSCNPFDYTISGSEMADGINELKALEAPIIAKFKEASASGEPDDAQMAALSEQYTAVQKEFISGNPENSAAGIALMNLDGEDFITAFEAMPPSFNNSILFPLAEMQYEMEKKNIEMEKKQQALQSGEVEAPNFTLKDLDGKDVSLSDFRGKWVILDFWGSWCPWCIKGFPELFEAYEKYKGELEIIGIDCKESEADWKAGVEKYKLPWVNVYNPEGTTLLSEYGVQGFPTKAIINPEGKIANITVGHNPAFFTVLTDLLGK